MLSPGEERNSDSAVERATSLDRSNVWVDAQDLQRNDFRKKALSFDGHPHVAGSRPASAIPPTRVDSRPLLGTN